MGVRTRTALVRTGHIFASTLHETLEEGLLQRVSGIPLTASQLRILRLMAVSGRTRVGEMARCLGISVPAASKGIDRLERLGLVVRSTEESDRRARLLALSEAGSGVMSAYEEMASSRLDRALRGLPEGEAARLSRLLERLSLSLLEEEGRLQAGCLRCAAHLDGNCAVGRARGGCPHAALLGRRTESVTVS